jgi:hypothetical protein
MKTQLRKPARDRASHTDQYKQEALELWRASGRTAAVAALPKKCLDISWDANQHQRSYIQIINESQSNREEERVKLSP